MQLIISACLSVRIIELENRLAYFDLIWYGRYTIGGYSTQAFKFPTIDNTNMSGEQTCKVGEKYHLRHDLTMMHDNRASENKRI
jgi:hypothetical protein